MADANSEGPAWSDEESESSCEQPPVRRKSLELLKLLIQNHYEVKGQVDEDGKVKYVFRSPRAIQQSGEDDGVSGSPRSIVDPGVPYQTMHTWGVPAWGRPPVYQTTDNLAALPGLTDQDRRVESLEQPESPRSRRRIRAHVRD